MWPRPVAITTFVMASVLLRNAAGWVARPVSTRLVARGLPQCTTWQKPRSISSSLRLLAAPEGQAGQTSPPRVEQTQDDDDSDDEDGEGGSGASGKRKSKLRAIRQHVNPLTKGYQMPVELPKDWIEKAYVRPLQPFHVDIGSARGQFCVNMARAYPNVNFLGLEIRKPCVEESMKKVQKYGVDNLHYLAVNANVDYARIANYLNEKSKIIRATIQYPDPHFKAKHAKRRMVQVELARAVSASLAPEGEILLQSDLEWVAQNMRECFADDPLIEDVMPAGEWMAENPLGIPTEREKLTLSRGDPVFRTLYRRRPGVAPPA